MTERDAEMENEMWDDVFEALSNYADLRRQLGDMIGEHQAKIALETARYLKDANQGEAK